MSLANDALELSVWPDAGARVHALRDRRTAREWLVQGAPPAGRPASRATYGAAEANGWDECFPTVGACSVALAPWASQPVGGAASLLEETVPTALRDHGELWGRRWQVERAGPALHSLFEDPRFRFERTLTVEGDRLLSVYALTNTGDVPLPWLWSQHCLLCTRPGERIALRGAGKLRPGAFLRDGVARRFEPFDWPGPGPDGLDLGHVLDTEQGVALKAYAATEDDIEVTIGGMDGALSMRWNAGDAPFVGVWLDYGGWPGTGAGVHQIAIEPTTAPVDDLAGAIAQGGVRTLAPGARTSWSIALQLLVSAPFSDEAPT